MTRRADDTSLPAIVYHALQDIQTDFREAHARIRADLTQASNTHTVGQAQLSKQLTDLQLSINTIQTERAMEKSAVLKRSALVSLVVGTGLTGLIKLMERWWHP